MTDVMSVATVELRGPWWVRGADGRRYVVRHGDRVVVDRDGAVVELIRGGGQLKLVVWAPRAYRPARVVRRGSDDGIVRLLRRWGWRRPPLRHPDVDPLEYGLVYP